MTIVDFITELFCCVDDKLLHSQAKLYPSEVVTIAMLFALMWVIDCWIANNFKSLFPKLPERTRAYPIVPLIRRASTSH